MNREENASGPMINGFRNFQGGGGVILEISAGVENLFLKNVPEHRYC